MDWFDPCRSLRMCNNNNINGSRYLNVSCQLRPHVDIHRWSAFTLYRAPCHKWKNIKDCVTAEKIQLLDWPDNNPDLWYESHEEYVMYCEKQTHEKQTFSAAALLEAIKQVWCAQSFKSFWQLLSIACLIILRQWLRQRRCYKTLNLLK